MTMSLRNCDSQHFVARTAEPATVGSHAYLMSSQLGVLAAYFVKLLGRFQHSVTSNICNCSGPDLAPIGSHTHKNKDIHNITPYVYGGLLDAKSFFAGRSARFALKPLCGDAKSSSQVKNYCHSLKWSHLTLAALTPTFLGEPYMYAVSRGWG